MNGEQEQQFKLDEQGSQKLTDWPKEPSILSLKEDLEAGKPAHDSQVAKFNRWNDMMAVKGTSKIKVTKGRSSVQPKLIRRQAEWRYSALTEPFLSSEKLFKVSPVTHEDENAARQNELVLNHQFRTKLNKVKFIDDYVRSDVDEGTVLVRTGWKRATVKIQEEVPVFGYYEIESEEELEALTQAIQAQELDPRSFDEDADPLIKAAVEHYKETGQPTIAEQSGTQIVEVDKVLENRPDLKVFNPANVIIDPSCEGDLDKAMFCIFTSETSKSELLKDDVKYQNLDKIVWDDGAAMTDQQHISSTPQEFQFKDAARKKVVVYEYWGFYDIEGNGTLTPIVCTWVGSTIIRMEKNPFPDQKLPLVLVQYLPVKRELHGEPDAELLEDNQKILGAVTRGMIDLLGRSANSQQGFAKGMLDPLNRRKLDNGQDYEFNPNSNPNGGLISHKYPELPQSAMAMLSLQNQEAEALTGVKSFAGGISGDAYGDVAAGIRGTLDAASKREMAILRRLAKGMQEIGEKIISMNGQFLSEEEVVRITNDKFEIIKREDLVGEFDLVVDISTAEVDEAQAKDLSFILQTIGPDMGLDMRKIILSEIANLKRMPELAHRIENYQPEPDPMQQKLQELEIAKAEKELELLQSEIGLNEAKAQAAITAADRGNLDFMEQQSGVAHARGIENQRAQAEGNQALEVTKALASEKDPTKVAPDVESAIGYNELTKIQGAKGLPEPGL